MVFVGNNWAGTADILDPRTFESLGTLNIIPDYEERMQEIATNPERLAYFLAIRAAIGEGNDQFVDDMYSSNDGRLMIVSRPSFADVVAISLQTHEIVWRFPVAGQRSDHMAISPNGKQVIVSASTGNVVHVLAGLRRQGAGVLPVRRISARERVRRRRERIIHASIGTVYTPLDRSEADATKGERVFQIVDAKRPFKVLRRYSLRDKLDARGLEDLSTAVRPMTLSPNEQRIYFQVSFFHGFLEMDRATGRILRVKRLPNLIKDTPRELYLLDSAHHGIAMNPKGSKICVAGTMSDYATVVDAQDVQAQQAAHPGRRQAVLGHAELERPALLHLVERDRPGLQDQLPDGEDRAVRPGG